MTLEAQASGDVTATLWSAAVGVGWQWYLGVFFLLLPRVPVQEFGCDSVKVLTSGTDALHASRAMDAMDRLTLAVHL